MRSDAIGCNHVCRRLSPINRSEVLTVLLPLCQENGVFLALLRGVGAVNMHQSIQHNTHDAMNLLPRVDVRGGRIREVTNQFATSAHQRHRLRKISRLLIGFGVQPTLSFALINAL